VSWRRHGSAILVLTVLTGLPVSGMVCALACAASGTVAPHHGAGEKCEGPGRASTGPLLSGVSEHACRTHDAAIRQAAATAAERADLSAVSAPLTSTLLGRFETQPLSSQSNFDLGAPLSIAPPGTIPLVLRV
jgi:hypothetical protein